jgi:uncharacterized membrane protein YhiD involved in acid resistance
MKMNKKVIMYIAIAVVLLAVAITGTVLVLNSVNKQNTVKANVVTKKTTNDLRAKAEAARKKNDTAEAKTLLLEAQQQVKELPKSDETTNTSVDIEAQLFLLKQAETAK